MHSENNKVKHYAFGGSNPVGGMTMLIYSCVVHTVRYTKDGAHASPFSWTKDKGEVTCKRCLRRLAHNQSPTYA